MKSKFANGGRPPMRQTVQFGTCVMIDGVATRQGMIHVHHQKYHGTCSGCIETAQGPQHEANERTLGTRWRAASGSRDALDLAPKVVVDKYAYSLPLIRQAACWAQLGLIITSAML